MKHNYSKPLLLKTLRTMDIELRIQTEFDLEASSLRTSFYCTGKGYTSYQGKEVSQ